MLGAGLGEGGFDESWKQSGARNRDGSQERSFGHWQLNEPAGRVAAFDKAFPGDRGTGAQTQNVVDTMNRLVPGFGQLPEAAAMKAMHDQFGDNGANSGQLGPGSALLAKVDRGGGAAPTAVAQTGDGAPFHQASMLTIGSSQYRYGSGGAKGLPSIPFGDFPIGTPVGPWGAAHGAIGINNGSIWDAKLGRNRSGIELHAGMSDTLLTEGCMAVAGKDWPQLKAQILAMGGKGFLHVGSGGASIDTSATGPIGGQQWRDPSVAPIKQADATNAGALDHRLAIDISHDKGVNTAISGAGNGRTTVRSVRTFSSDVG